MSLPELTRAAASGNLPEVDRLLQQSPGAAGAWQPIMDACYHGHPAVVERLLDAGANPNAVSPNKHTPLHRAIETRKELPRREGHLAVVRLLLKRGADPHLRASWHKATPLATAAFDGACAFVELLLPAYQPLDLFAASVLGEADRVHELLEADPGRAAEADGNGFQPLHYCVASGMGREAPETSTRLQDIARRLIRCGADVNARVSRYHLPPMHWAFPNPAVAEVLVEHGADPTDGLNNALFHGTEVAERLLAWGADLNRGDAKGQTALHEMVHWGQVGSSLWLLEHGANPNLQDRNGATPLHEAAARGNSPRLIQALLAAGADRTLRNAQGLTAREVAAARGKTKVLPLLEG